MDRLRFCLNDRWVELSGVSPTTTLLRFLRDNAHLTGTKEGCAEGDCGACTVAVAETDAAGQAVYRSVNSCLVLLPMVQGKRVYTVEGLKDGAEYHPVQKALAEELGSQCGYCTPGVVMAMFESAYRADFDEPWKLDAAMCGNLCRCTGYRPIREATQRVAGMRPADRFSRNLVASSNEPMQLSYQAGPQKFFTPATLSELFDVLDENPAARFVVGGTDLSLEVTKRYAEPELLVSLEAIPELRKLEPIAGGHRIGASVSLTDLEDYSRGKLTPVERMLRYFGARQIKNRGTVGGNLCNASPIGDLPPVMISLGATCVAVSRKGERRIPADQFFVSYRKTALEKGEVLGWVEVPSIPLGARASSYKVSKRRELDISAVAAGFFVLVDGAGKVSEIRLAYGGMAATPARAKKTEAALLGQPLTRQSIEAALPRLAEDFSPLSDHRGSAKYRALLARNLLIGFFEETAKSPIPRLPHPHTATAQVGAAEA
ncbi:MAG: xanthine dehydrogenase small subunit [Myxococcaceae bacterium]